MRWVLEPFKSGPGRSVGWSPPDMRTVAVSILESGNMFFVEIGNEIMSTPILFLPLIHWRKDVHLMLVNRLGRLPRNSVVRLSDRHDMSIVVEWDVKPYIKQTNKQTIFKDYSLTCFKPSQTSSSSPGFPQALENMENGWKKSMHGKIMEFEN